MLGSTKHTLTQSTIPCKLSALESHKQKYCTDCLKRKPFTEFKNDSQRKNGKHTICMECSSKYTHSLVVKPLTALEKAKKRLRSRVVL